MKDQLSFNIIIVLTAIGYFCLGLLFSMRAYNKGRMDKLKEMIKEGWHR